MYAKSQREVDTLRRELAAARELIHSLQERSNNSPPRPDREGRLGSPDFARRTADENRRLNSELQALRQRFDEELTDLEARYRYSALHPQSDADIARLEDQIATLEGEKKSLASQLKRSQGEVATAQKIIATLQGKLEEGLKVNEQLVGRLKNARMQKQKLTASLEEANADREALREHNSSLVQQIERSSGESALFDNDQQTEMLSEKCSQLQDQFDTVSAANTEFIQKHAELCAVVGQLQDEIARLRGQSTPDRPPPAPPVVRLESPIDEEEEDLSEENVF
jgi:chromosome segregation ATPase